MQKNIPLFVTNDFVVTLGNSIFTILIMWYVYDITQTAIATAIIGSFPHISRFFAGPIAGVYADQSDKPLSLMKWALRVNSVLVIFMIGGVYFLKGDPEIWAIFILVALRELTFCFEDPAQTRVMPMLVPVHTLSKLIGYRSVSSNIADLLGNAVAGFLYASVGIIGGLIFNSVTFFVGTIILSFLLLLTPKERGLDDETTAETDQSGGNVEEISGTSDSSQQEKGSLKEDLIKGFKYLWAHEYLKRIAIIALLANIGSMILPIIVVYFNNFLGSSANAYGFFNAALTIGSILSGLLAGRINKKFKNATIVIVGWGLLALTMMVMFLKVPILITYVLGFFLGVGMTLPAITLDTVQVLIVPDQYRGRTQTILQAIGVVLIPLSNIVGGVIADGLGANYVFLIAGIWQVIVVMIVFFNRQIFNLQES